MKLADCIACLPPDKRPKTLYLRWAQTQARRAAHGRMSTMNDMSDTMNSIDSIDSALSPWRLVLVHEAFALHFPGQTRFLRRSRAEKKGYDVPSWLKAVVVEDAKWNSGDSGAPVGAAAMRISLARIGCVS